MNEMSTPKTSAQLAAEELKRKFFVGRDSYFATDDEIADIISKHFPQPLPVIGECEFCEPDGLGNHAPRCPVQLESEIENLRADLLGMLDKTIVGVTQQKATDEINRLTTELATEQKAFVTERELTKQLATELATERTARELIEDASRKMSFENATLHLRVVAAEARISELESENQNHAEHVLLERGLRQAAEAARELAEKERDSSRNFADSLMSNLDQIRIATEWLDDGFGPNTATALALKAARELKRIKELRGTHDCDCEICSRTSKVCPATTSSYALALMEAEARASVAESKSGDVAKLRDALEFYANPNDWEQGIASGNIAGAKDGEPFMAFSNGEDHPWSIAQAALASVPAEKGQKE